MEAAGSYLLYGSLVISFRFIFLEQNACNVRIMLFHSFPLYGWMFYAEKRDVKILKYAIFAVFIVEVHGLEK
jgi:hypothetical protein